MWCASIISISKLCFVPITVGGGIKSLDDAMKAYSIGASRVYINTALATISFKGDGSTGSPTITVSITPTGSSYFSGNGHYYQVYNSNAIRWANAKTQAESKTFNGLSGYLVTIESAEENAFIFSKISQSRNLKIGQIRGSGGSEPPPS